MYTKYLSIPLLLLSLTTAFSQHSGDSFSKAVRYKKANLTYLYKKPPAEGINNGLVLVNDDGNHVGLLVEVMNAFELYVKEKYAIQITSKYVEVDKSFKLFTKDIVNSNQGVFGLGSHSINEERKKILKFSPPYINNVSVLISNNRVPTLISLEDISKTFGTKKAYTIPSTTYHKMLLDLKESQFPQMEISTEPNMYEMLTSIIEKDGFGYVDIIFYLQYLKAKNPVKRHPIGDLTGDSYGITMPLDNDWEPVLKEFLNSEFLKSAEYRQIVSNTLGKGALRMLRMQNLN